MNIIFNVENEGEKMTIYEEEIVKTEYFEVDTYNSDLTSERIL